MYRNAKVSASLLCLFLILLVIADKKWVPTGYIDLEKKSNVFFESTLGKWLKNNCLICSQLK